MTQLVKDPTRISESSSSNILDLIFCNDPMSIQITNHLPPLSTSDHNIVEFIIFPPFNTSCSPLVSNYHTHKITDSGDPPQITLYKYNWSAADYISISNHLLQFDWFSLFGFFFDVDLIWVQFKSIIWPIIDLYVPRTAVPHFTKYNVRHYPKHIRILLNRKAAIWRTLRKHKTPELKIKYSKISLETKQAIVNFDIINEERMVKSNNLGAFYRFVNNKLNNSGIAPLYDLKGNLLTSDEDKAQLLNDYFKSVFTTDDGNLPFFPSRFPPKVHEIIDDIQITPEIINKILCKLKSNSAAGIDHIPAIFFKQTSRANSSPLAIMYRSFIDLKDIPSEWKKAIITPKFKKGQPSLPSNYRPIALTCSCCKIWEKIIVDKLIDFLQLHNLINRQQPGFLKQHSTATNLLDSLNDWTLSLSTHQSTAIAYIDFQRAFDSVSHEKLIHKLNSYGISGNLLHWIKNFLTSRSQTVRIGSAFSNSCPVSSGIPQGSVLGPILFILFVNEIADPFGQSVKSKLFADNIKIYSNISDLSSAMNFQVHLDLINSWSKPWQLPIAHSKCNLFQIGSHFRLSPSYNFKLDNIEIARTKTVIDLGIHFDENVKFISHIHEISKRANQRANLIHRTFLSKNSHSLVKAYKVYVLPLLEFNSIIWSPSQIGLINTVESVQRDFTKRLLGLNTVSYADRLTILNLQSLEHRRLICDLVACYNIVHHLIANEFDKYFTFSHNPSSRGHHLRLSLPLTETNSRKYFFSSRMIKPWNSLSSQIVSSENVKTFKSRLSKTDLSKFLNFPSLFS